MIEFAWGGKIHAIPSRCLDLLILYEHIHCITLYKYLYLYLLYIDKIPS